MLQIELMPISVYGSLPFSFPFHTQSVSHCFLSSQLFSPNSKLTQKRKPIVNFCSLYLPKRCGLILFPSFQFRSVSSFFLSFSQGTLWFWQREKKAMLVVAVAIGKAFFSEPILMEMFFKTIALVWFGAGREMGDGEWMHDFQKFNIRVLWC